MNKIFKIVFNAARGKMMVVNEATSSVQTGKKAAVTVAVIGALASGVAMAESYDYTVESNLGQVAETVVVDTNEAAKEYLGGGKLSSSTGTYYIKDTNLIIDNAQVGIGNSSGWSGAYILGGSKASSTYGSISTENTNLTINGGNVFAEQNEKYDYQIRQYVVAGDSLKVNVGTGKKDVTSSIGTTNLTINGGEFDVLVLGGSLAYDYEWYVTDYDKYRPDALMETKVGTSNVTITGGTFNLPVFGAGMAYGYNWQTVDSSSQHYKNLGGGATAVVDKVNMNITGGEFKSAIYAGGVVNGDGDWNKRIEYLGGELTVTNGADVTISNTTVKSFYGATASVTSLSDLNDAVRAGSDVDEYFTIDKDVVTNLTLVNATVTDTVYVKEGTVNLRAEGAEGGVTVKTATIGDGVTVSATADGAFNDSVGGDAAKAKEAFKFGDSVIDTLKLEEGAIVGAVTDDGQGSVVMQVNKKTEALAEKVTLAPQMITRILMNDLRKRMGDIRAAEGTHGAWVRYNGGEMSGQGIDNDFHMIQVGVDTVPVADAPRFGVAFSYAQSEAEDVYGTTDMDSYSLAVYGTKMYDNGMFVDVIGRMATMDTDMVNVGNKAKMDNVALSLSGELGWRFDVTDSFFIEPSVEATYTYTNADKFALGNVGTIELESTDSLVGRAGFAAGFKCPKNFGDVYVRAAVVHEFMGDTTMNSWAANGNPLRPVEADGEDTWFEYAIGANFNINKNTYVYADIERTEGAAMDEDWRANVGVRFAF